MTVNIDNVPTWVGEPFAFHKRSLRQYIQMKRCHLLLRWVVTSVERIRDFDRIKAIRHFAPSDYLFSFTD